MSAEEVARRDIKEDIIPYITNNAHYIEVWDACTSHIFTTKNRRNNKKIFKNQNYESSRF